MNQRTLITKETVEALLTERKKDSLSSHLPFLRSTGHGLIGEVKSREVRLWRYSRFLGMFYTVLTLSFNESGQLIKASTAMNSFGRIVYLLLYLFPPLMVSDLLLHFTSLKVALLSIAILVSSWAFLFVVSTAIYRFEKNNFLEMVGSRLGVRLTKEKPLEQKEWTFEKIVTRLFLYPFSLSFIVFGAFYLIPAGNYMLAMGAMIFAGTYLSYDISMIIKSRQDRHKNHHSKP